MCDTNPSFLLLFNRQMNLWMAENRRPMKGLPFLAYSHRQIPEGLKRFRLFSSIQKIIPNGGPWGTDGLALLTQQQHDEMTEVVEFLANYTCFAICGQEGEEFFVDVVEDRLQAMYMILTMQV